MNAVNILFSKIAVFLITTLFVLSYHFFYSHMQNRHQYHTSLSYSGRVSLVLDSKQGLTLNMTSANISSRQNIYDYKNCFYLSWRHPSKLKTYNELSRYISTGTVANLSNHRKEICKRFVTIAKLGGRMGNQMFEIASIFGVAYSYDIIPVIPLSNLLNTYMDLPNVYYANLERLENVLSCYGKKAGVFNSCKQSLNSTSNVTIHGFLQSWKYFNDATNIINEVFSFKAKHILNARKFLDNVTKAGYQHVCIHVRRGDFLQNTNRGFTVANISYIERAKLFYIKKYGQVDFVLATDDKRWCRENVKHVAISPFESPGDDMALMKLCDHVIITSGTFGWWGAWLSGGTTVYFKGYPGHGLSLQYNTDDYYPHGWIGL